MKRITPLYQLLPTLLFLVPTLARAVDAPENFGDFITIINDLIALLIPFIFGLTFLTIAWGITRSWIMGGGESKQIEEGKKIITVGIIALVVMVSIWGIIKVLQASFFGITG